MAVAERRINKPQDIKRIIAEQINILRSNDELDPIKRANAIGYLSTVALSAIKDGDMQDQIDELKKLVSDGGSGDF